MQLIPHERVNSHFLIQHSSFFSAVFYSMVVLLISTGQITIKVEILSNTRFSFYHSYSLFTLNLLFFVILNFANFANSKSTANTNTRHNTIFRCSKVPLSRTLSISNISQSGTNMFVPNIYFPLYLELFHY